MIVVFSGTIIILLLGGLLAYHTFQIDDNARHNSIHSTSTKLNFSQELEMETQDKPYKCRCGIVSRRYQLKGEEQTICPHCDFDMKQSLEGKISVGMMMRDDYILYRNGVADNREFPFAPKLTESTFLEYWDMKEEMKRIEKEKNDLIETDKELEAWQNLQLKKLEEYQRKAEEIKKELSDDNKIFGKMKWTNDEL